MKIAQISHIAESVPPEKYGGTERVVYNLTEELVRRGHEVTLFGSGDSRTSAKLVSVSPTALRKTHIKDIYGSNAITMFHIGFAYQYQDEFDIIHDHFAPISAPIANLAHTPTVLTMHGAFDELNKGLYENLDNLNLVTISNQQKRLAPSLKNIIGTVYNGLAMEHYPFRSDPKNYLLFVGRISAQKGVHIAINVAKRLHIQLVIAAKLDPLEIPYFEKYVKPHLNDPLIYWVGEVAEKERNNLMKNALCFLHPVTWAEPFGLTMIEAMACGCPVVAFDQGSIPEIVKDSKTGYVVKTENQMVQAVKQIKKIDRLTCRQYALSKFSAKRMTDEYEIIYQTIISNKLTYDIKRRLTGLTPFSKFLRPQDRNN